MFSGSHSVGKVCEELGWDCVSLDLHGADINTDILEWDYTKDTDFDIVWSSIPCQTFSKIRNSWIGRRYKNFFNNEVITKTHLHKDMIEKGLPLVERTLDIMLHIKPKIWFIENPMTGRMKDYLELPYYDVDYCKYSDWGYRKSTRVWTNLIGFHPKRCKFDCDNLDDAGRHRTSLGRTYAGRKDLKHRVPHKLIKELFTVATQQI